MWMHKQSMVSKVLGLWILVLLMGFTMATYGGSRSTDFKEVPADQMDRRALTARGKLALAMPDMKWRHAETPHYVLHFERVTFARKVARMAEFFYSFISEQLHASEDFVDGRSHIFIFRKEKQWAAFLAQSNASHEWAFSFVQGPAMFLQQAGHTKQSGSILAHEMTHLVVNRFFRGNPPLWLNEGLAEWYEEFGYAAYKGTKKSKRSQFRKMRYRWELDRLVATDRYPQDPRDVRAFYETSKFLVAYLLLEHDPGKMVPFTQDLINGTDVYAALRMHYGISSREALADDFDDFVR